MPANKIINYVKYTQLRTGDQTRIRIDIEAGEAVLAVTVSNDFQIPHMTVEESNGNISEALLIFLQKTFLSSLYGVGY